MNDPKDDFKRFLLYSLVGHSILLVILTVKVVFFPKDLQKYERAVRVDMVALPEKIKQQVPLAKKEEKPKPQVKEEPKAKPEPKKEVAKAKPKKPKKKKAAKKPKPKPKVVAKKEQSSALARLRAMQKLKKNQKAERETQKKEYKGNELSKGNSLTGIQKLQHSSYLSDLDNHIKNFWNLPEWLANEDLKATVLLLISETGRIKSKKFIIRSGNTLFDQHVSGTLEKAEPFPKPPEELISFFGTKGVEVRFPE